MKLSVEARQDETCIYWFVLLTTKIHTDRANSPRSLIEQSNSESSLNLEIKGQIQSIHPCRRITAFQLSFQIEDQQLRL